MTTAEVELYVLQDALHIEFFESTYELDGSLYSEVALRFWKLGFLKGDTYLGTLTITGITPEGVQELRRLEAEAVAKTTKERVKRVILDLLRTGWRWIDFFRRCGNRSIRHVVYAMGS